MWKCPTCNKLNKFENHICKCRTNLEEIEDLSALLIEVPIEVEIKEESKAEPEAMKEDEWVCEE